MRKLTLTPLIALVIFSYLCVCAAHAQNIVRGERPTGQIRLKVAVMNYEPLFDFMDNRPYWDVCGWTDPRRILPMIFDGVEEAFDGHVIMELVHWTNVNMFPYSGINNRHGTRRYTAQQYYDDWHGGWPSDMVDAKLFQEGYYMALTNDFPHIIEMVDNGEVDHVIMFGGPWFGYWETQMVGLGAIWCNSSPISDLTERIFVINGMNVERAGSGLHNYGHGLAEDNLGAWFCNNNVANYWNTLHAPYTNINDWILFSRCRNNLGGNINASPIHVGNTHFAPNSTADYQYDNSTDLVKSYADQWFDFPNLVAPGRMMHSRSPNSWYWPGEREDDAFQKWFWNHVPRYMGSHFATPTNRFRKGHMNNWLNYIWNFSGVGYPLGSGHPVTLHDVDMRGWFAYRVDVPPEATSVSITVSSTRNTFRAGIRKNYLPYLGRRGTGNFAADNHATVNNGTITWNLTPGNNYGKGLPGTWYITLGGSGEAYSTFNTHSYTVDVTITPTPTNTTPPAIAFTTPTEGQVFDITSTPRKVIAWTVDGLPQGVRASYIAWQPSPEDEWLPIAEDYIFNIDGEYLWRLPSVNTTNARVKVILEDVYGVMYTHISDTFTLFDPPPDPSEWHDVPLPHAAFHSYRSWMTSDDDDMLYLAGWYDDGDVYAISFDDAINPGTTAGDWTHIPGPANFTGGDDNHGSGGAIIGGADGHIYTILKISDNARTWARLNLTDHTWTVSPTPGDGANHALGAVENNGTVYLYGHHVGWTHVRGYRVTDNTTLAYVETANNIATDLTNWGSHGTVGNDYYYVYSQGRTGNSAARILRAPLSTLPIPAGAMSFASAWTARAQNNDINRRTGCRIAFVPDEYTVTDTDELWVIPVWDDGDYVSYIERYNADNGAFIGAVELPFTVDALSGYNITHLNGRIFVANGRPGEPRLWSLLINDTSSSVSLSLPQGIVAEHSPLVTGYASSDIVGDVSWSNLTTGVHGTYTAGDDTPFQLPLALDTNTVRLTATTQQDTLVTTNLLYIRIGNDFDFPADGSTFSIYAGDTVNVHWKNGWMGPLGGSNFLAWSYTGLEGPWDNLASGTAHNTLTNYLFTAPFIAESDQCYFRLIHYCADADMWSTNYSTSFTVVPEPGTLLSAFALLLLCLSTRKYTL